MFQVIVFQLFDPTIPCMQGGGKSVNQYQYRTILVALEDKVHVIAIDLHKTRSGAQVLGVYPLSGKIVEAYGFTAA